MYAVSDRSENTSFIMRPLLFPLLFGVVLQVLCFHSVFSQNTGALDAQNGFLELRLGAEFESFKGLEFKKNYLKKQVYHWNHAPKTYADIRFEEIKLHFFKKRLHSIEIHLNKEAEATKLLDLFNLYYGPGEQLGMAPNYTWEGELVKLTYEQNLFTKNTIVIFESVEVERIFASEYIVR